MASASPGRFGLFESGGGFGCGFTVGGGFFGGGFLSSSCFCAATPIDRPATIANIKRNFRITLMARSSSFSKITPNGERGKVRPSLSIAIQMPQTVIGRYWRSFGWKE
jgi:hypothetical protein